VVRHPQWITQRKRVNPATALDSPLDVLLHRLGLASARVERVEHHLAHLYSARFLSREKEVALASLDGMGDFVSATLGVGHLDECRIMKRIQFPDSVGYFYTAMTQFLGFPHYGDEFKVMGLSSFGKPKFLPQMHQLIRDKDIFGFELNREAFPILQNPIEFWMEHGQPKTKPFYHTNLVTQIIGVPPRKGSEALLDVHHDLAKSVQIRFEEIASRFLNHLYELTNYKTVCLAGGCAHNSVWVGKIKQQTPFQEIHVAPASHDAGIAVGAAIACAKRVVSVRAPNWALLGPVFHFSDTWQLVINTGTTIITFLMVFLIQNTQNRDSRALHLKLDELIRATQARDVFADLEDASEQELDAFQREFRELHLRGVRGMDAAIEAGKSRRRS
jgi:predicted NodU family carbamoyl transferase